MDIKKFEELKALSIGHSLIKAARLHNETAINALKQSHKKFSKLKPSHMQLFPHIPFDGITIIELAKRLDISKQAVSVLVRDLLDYKVLKKKSNPNDKRSFLITFKTEGKESIFEGMKHLAKMDEKLLTVLNKNEVKILNSALHKIINLYEN
jgi:DNA-binding MarR family transcriptional regulator